VFRGLFFIPSLLEVRVKILDPVMERTITGMYDAFAKECTTKVSIGNAAGVM
jgi:hypothetical protein